MRTDCKTSLGLSIKNLGECGRILRARSFVSSTVNDQTIGCGTARDYLCWAHALIDMTFNIRTRSASKRKLSIIEVQRFGLMWTGTNALYGRDSILQVLGTANSSASELKKYEMLHNYAASDPLAQKTVDDLNRLLGMSCQASNVTAVLTTGGLPTMWEVIDQKYFRITEQGVSNKIRRKLVQRIKPVLSGPELVYATRNWMVHGVLLTSFFRGSSQKFLTYIDLVTLLLSISLRESTDYLLKHI